MVALVPIPVLASVILDVEAVALVAVMGALVLALVDVVDAPVLALGVLEDAL